MTLSQMLFPLAVEEVQRQWHTTGCLQKPVPITVSLGTSVMEQRGCLPIAAVDTKEHWRTEWAIKMVLTGLNHLLGKKDLPRKANANAPAFGWDSSLQRTGPCFLQIAEDGWTGSWMAHLEFSKLKPTEMKSTCCCCQQQTAAVQDKGLQAGAGAPMEESSRDQHARGNDPSSTWLSRVLEHHSPFVRHSRLLELRQCWTGISWPGWVECGAAQPARTAHRSRAIPVRSSQPGGSCRKGFQVCKRWLSRGRTQSVLHIP